jgi:hypothetical protein
MRTDGRFDFKVVEIPAKYNEPITIFFHGDDHFNSPNHAKKKWLQDNEDMKEHCKKHPTYFIKTGDAFEAMSTSERRAYIGAGLHDSNMTRWENEYLAEIDDYVAQTKFMVGRTLAVYGGNHFFKFYDGTTSDQVLANKLKAPYIGCSGYVLLTLRVDKYHSHVVKIFVHHGLGSGRSAGSTFNALDKAASYFPDADILIMGHDHQAGAMHLPAINIDKGGGNNWKIKEHDRIIGRAGSYLKAYEPGKVSYAVDAMYRPSTLGALRVDVTVRRQQLGGRENKDDEKWVQVKAVI